MISFESFKSTFEFERRKKEAENVLTKYPTRIPIICERAKYAGADCPFIDKKKYLVPMQLTVGQFILVIRKRLKMRENQSLFLFVNNTIPSTTHLIGELYSRHRDLDRFLYITYSFENVFG